MMRGRRQRPSHGVARVRALQPCTRYWPASTPETAVRRGQGLSASLMHPPPLLCRRRILLLGSPLFLLHPAQHPVRCMYGVAVAAPSFLAAIPLPLHLPLFIHSSTPFLARLPVRATAPLLAVVGTTGWSHHSTQSHLIHRETKQIRLHRLSALLSSIVHSILLCTLGPPLLIAIAPLPFSSGDCSSPASLSARLSRHIRYALLRRTPLY